MSVLLFKNVNITYKAQIAFSVKPVVADITANTKVPVPTLVWTGNRLARISEANPGYRNVTKPVKSWKHKRNVKLQIEI